VLMERLNDATGELAWTAQVLNKDAKNYHAWAYRQWVLKNFNLWSGELDYVDRLLQDDLRNNSAWNQRWLTIASTTGFTSDVISREIKYVCTYIDKAVNNDSPWNYLEGMLKATAFSSDMRCEVCEETAAEWKCKECEKVLCSTCNSEEHAKGKSLAHDRRRISSAHVTTLERFARSVLQKDSGCACAHSFLLESHEKFPNGQKLREAMEICDKLCELDGIRQRYWQHRKAGIQAKLEKSQDGGGDVKGRSRAVSEEKGFAVSPAGPASHSAAGGQGVAAAALVAPWWWPSSLQKDFRGFKPVG